MATRIIGAGIHAAPLGDNVAEICLNGHDVIAWVDKDPTRSEEYCERCGAKTIRACPDCEAPIRGIRAGGMIIADTVPTLCDFCSQPFPWTAGRLEAAREMVELLATPVI